MTLASTVKKILQLIQQLGLKRLTTYGTVKTPVVIGYYADKAVAGGKTVTPDAPNATDTVTYKAFGKFIAVDENGNPIPGVSTTAYTNDPNDATKMIAIDKTLPSIPGYTVKVVPATPGDLSSDTKVVYVKNDQKQVLLTVMKQAVQSLKQLLWLVSLAKQLTIQQLNVSSIIKTLAMSL